MIIIELIYNLSILVSLSVLSGFINTRFDRCVLKGQLFQGFLFGFTAIVGMLYPFVLTEGIFFDGRSVVISLCTLFFGPVSGIISALMAIIFRIYLGGSGLIMGVLVISSSFIIGLIFYNWRSISVDSNLSNTKLYLLGLLVHVAMLIFVLTLPSQNIRETYKVITFTVIGIYPIVTVIIGKILLDQEQTIINLRRIKESEELFRTTLYSIGDAVITTDKSGSIRYLNQVAENLTGWKEEEAKGKPLHSIFNIINEETREKVENPVFKVLECGKIVGLANHTLLISKEGKEIPIADSGAPIKNQNGEIIGVVLVFRDQTEERVAQKAISESEEKYRSLIESTEDLVYLIDKNLTFLYANKKYLNRHGLSKEQINGLKYSTFHSAINTEEFRKKINDVIENEKSFTYQHTSEKDGITYLRTLSPVRNLNNNEVIAVTVISKDITELIKAEENLLLNQFCMDNSSVAIFRISEPEGNIVSVNDYACKSLGYTREELLKLKIMDIDPTLDKKTWLENRRRVRRQSKTSVFETVHMRKDGTLFPVEVTINYMEYKGEDISFSFAKDITERKKAEEELRKSELRYRSIFENNHAVMLLIDPVTRKIVDVNPAAVKFYGYSRNELISMDMNKINTLSEQEIADEMNKAFESKKNYFEFRHRISDGTIKDVEVYSGKTEIQGKELLYSIVHDITEKKLVEKQVNTLRRAIEQSSVGIMITDKNGTIEYINPYFTTVSGYSFEEVIGKNPRILKSGEQDSKFYEVLWNTITSGKDWSGELINKKKNGDFFWEKEIITPILNEEGEIVHFVAIREDITEKKKMIEELIQAKNRAENLNRLKTEFLAQMSHEIRSPINLLLNYTALIKDDLNTDISEEISISFDGIESAGRRIIRTIDLILNMSELQLGTYEVTKREFDIEKSIRVLMKEYYSSAASKNIELNINTNTSNTIIISDDYAVNQIFANLIDNAIKYTHKGEIRIDINENNNRLVVSVGDTGIGISEEYLKKIFTPFTQEEQGYSRTYDGTGLGLALVKKYCELIGAEIEVKSSKGEGTTFNIFFS